jgi:hypothetical protein
VYIGPTITDTGIYYTENKYYINKILVKYFAKRPAYHKLIDQLYGSIQALFTRIAESDDSPVSESSLPNPKTA